MISPRVQSTDTPTTAGTAQRRPSSRPARKPRYETLSTIPEMARAPRREKRDIQTVTGTWNATTSTVFVTKTTATHTGDACSCVTSTSGSATSGTLRQNT